MLSNRATGAGTIEVRACACAFCRRHGARCISGPDDSAQITVRDPSQLLRYSFALKTAEFLVCKGCGVYVGAVMQDGERSYAVININTFQDPNVFTCDAKSMNYDNEDDAGRRERRRQRWVPVTVTTLAGATDSQRT